MISASCGRTDNILWKGVIKKMVNTSELRRKISASGYKLVFLAGQCGMTYPALLNKIEGKTAFKVSEAGTLKDLLKMDDTEFNEIFFARDVDGQPTGV